MKTIVAGVVMAASVIGLQATAQAQGKPFWVERVSTTSPIGPIWEGPCETREVTHEWEWESSIAVDPTDPRRMAVAWLQDDALGVTVASTHNGGHHWDRTIVPGLTACTGGTWPRVFHPRLNFSPDGVLYLMTHPSQGDGGPVNGILFNRSFDGGQTWSAPETIETLPGFNDFDTGVVESDTGAFGFIWSDLEATGDLIYLERTTDRGETWDRHVVRRAAPGTVSFNDIVALPNGRLILFSQDASVGEFFGADTGSTILVTYSDDKGATWSLPQTLAGDSMREWPVVTATPDGAVHLTYRTRAGDDETVWMMSSDDGAETWSEPSAAFTLTGGPIPLPQPMIAAHGDSLGMLVYDYSHDAAGDESITVGAALMTSVDDGATWARTEIGDPFDYRAVPDYASGNALGFFNGIAATGCGFAASAVLGGQTDMTGPTDVYLAAVEPRPCKSEETAVRAHECVGAAPFASTPCPGVRPGAVVNMGEPPLETLSGGCTLGFVFDGSDGNRYITTAGHCAGIGSEERTWVPGEGIPAFDNQWNRFGELIYAVQDIAFEEFAPEMDMALIRIDDGIAVDPQMCHFGGPTGLNSGLSKGAPTLLHYFGNTVAGGYLGYQSADLWGLSARTGLAQDLRDDHRVYLTGHASKGDSGAPILGNDGRAVGILNAPGEARADGYAGAVSGTRLAHQIAAAESALGIELELVTAPLISES